MMYRFTAGSFFCPPDWAAQIFLFVNQE